jgi:hypothetical protein
MKTSTTKRITANCALVLALALLSGCASKSYDKGAATSQALSSSADATAQTSTRIYDVLGALNNLTFKSQGDLRDQYDALVSASKNLDSSAASLDDKVLALQGAAAEYLNNWTNQMAAIQNPELRQRSAERREQVQAQLNEVTASYQGVKDSLKAFTADAKDIQTYLGTDLTVAGLNSVKDTVAKTKLDVLPLRDSIKKLQGSFASLSAALSPVLPVPDQK